MCRSVIDGMRERKFGRIVNIGSINGQAGQYGQVNYAAAKVRHPRVHQGARAGRRRPGHHRQRHRPRLCRHRHGAGRAIADILQKIIQRIPMGRLGRGEDIARGVLFLVADEADFVTGYDPLDQWRPAYVLADRVRSPPAACRPRYRVPHSSSSKNLTARIRFCGFCMIA
jgi:NAD(P)-dependent dehydrogenase (short-subunit alcohol dehydrogenase family)